MNSLRRFHLKPLSPVLGERVGEGVSACTLNATAPIAHHKPHTSSPSSVAFCTITHVELNRRCVQRVHCPGHHPDAKSKPSPSCEAQRGCTERREHIATPRSHRALRRPAQTTRPERADTAGPDRTTLAPASPPPRFAVPRRRSRPRRRPGAARGGHVGGLHRHEDAQSQRQDEDSRRPRCKLGWRRFADQSVPFRLALDFVRRRHRGYEVLCFSCTVPLRLERPARIRAAEAARSAARL